MRMRCVPSLLVNVNESCSFLPASSFTSLRSSIRVLKVSRIFLFVPESRSLHSFSSATASPITLSVISCSCLRSSLLASRSARRASSSLKASNRAFSSGVISTIVLSLSDISLSFLRLLLSVYCSLTAAC